MGHWDNKRRLNALSRQVQGFLNVPVVPRRKLVGRECGRFNYEWRTSMKAIHSGLGGKISRILKDIKALEQNPSPDSRLPQNTYYLNEKEILCLPREYGESRFPYDTDGLVVWARSTGYIDACESTFCVFKPAHFGEEACINFFAGLKTACGDYFPVSISGANRQLFEPGDVSRYVVFSPCAAYYIVDMDKATFAVRLYLDNEKNIRFSVIGINKTSVNIEFYLASYFEALLRFKETESFWDKMSKFGRRYANGSYILKSIDRGANLLTINLEIVAENILRRAYTTKRGVFMGMRGRNLTNAESLRRGGFAKAVDSVTATDLPVAADLVHFSIGAGQSARMEYCLAVTHDEKAAEALLSRPINIPADEAALVAREVHEWARLDNLEIKFDGWRSGRLNSAVVSRFMRNVQKQVSFCALGKNYAGRYIGIRDVFQQLEGALMWQPEESRAKILVAMNYILSDGRTPRQFSVPADENALPELDLREYVDQGVWIISTIYTYLAFTDDYSILNEECSYYELTDRIAHSFRKSDMRDSVLEHMLKIMEYLISKLDTECGTNCLRVLSGDWNDALNGLGRTKDPGRDYGSGVTVMASLQFMRNLSEMAELLEKLGGHDKTAARYRVIGGDMRRGLIKYAVDMAEDGRRRIVHGWGDKFSYKIGSFCDCDGKARFSLAANAFWVIAGMLEEDLALKDSVMEGLRALDSKYGLRTFDVPFPEGCTGAGRISWITPGTYENACAYVHASMFGIMALFGMGQAEEAWRQLEKSMVISHENSTMTPFVMPNSYCENPEYNIDGESTGDWYTGSGTALIKGVVSCAFGISPNLDSLVLKTPRYLPADHAEIRLKVKGCTVRLTYRGGDRKRRITVNGAGVEGKINPVSGVAEIVLGRNMLAGHLEIEVNDGGNAGSQADMK